jgi:hypothetical protein
MRWGSAGEPPQAELSPARLARRPIGSWRDRMDPLVVVLILIAVPIWLALIVYIVRTERRERQCGPKS